MNGFQQLFVHLCRCLGLLAVGCCRKVLGAVAVVLVLALVAAGVFSVTACLGLAGHHALVACGVTTAPPLLPPVLRGDIVNYSAVGFLYTGCAVVLGLLLVAAYRVPRALVRHVRKIWRATAS